MTNLWKYFWLHTRKSWKIHVVFMMVSVGFWPLGSKNYPELKEDGDWPDPALRCEITPGSHVFLLSLFTLRFQKSQQIACKGPTDLLQATSLVQMQPLIFFFCCSFTGTVAAMRKSVRNHRTQLLGDRATWLFIIPNLEDILGNYFLLVFRLKAFTLSLTVSRKWAKWLLQLRSVLPALWP